MNDADDGSSMMYHATKHPNDCGKQHHCKRQRTTHPHNTHKKYTILIITKVKAEKTTKSTP
jgi:hypothetical protein